MNASPAIRLLLLLPLMLCLLLPGNARAEEDYPECPPIEYDFLMCGSVHFPSRAKACPKTGCAHVNAAPKVSLDCLRSGADVYCEVYPQSAHQAYQYHWSTDYTLQLQSWVNHQSPYLHARCNNNGTAWVAVTVIAPGGGQDSRLVSIDCPMGGPHRPDVPEVIEP